MSFDLGALLREVAGAGAAAGLAGVLPPPAICASSAPQLTPAQATQLSPDQVTQIASHAEQHSPGIIDKMSAFYAEHPGLVKTLGSAALTIALAKMAEHHNA